MSREREPVLEAPPRRRAVAVRVGGVTLGGGAPVVVQSMTNTDTAEVAATVEQIAQLVEAGSELVRLTVNQAAAARAVPAIREALDARGLEVPLIGDFHFNGQRLLAEHPECAEALAKYRINPGNLGRGERRDRQFSALIELACRHRRPVRIGVNGGSLDAQLMAQLMDENARAPVPQSARAVRDEALVQSALTSARRAEKLGLDRQYIVLSCKVSGVQDLIRVYRRLAARGDYALHLGLTEAGMGSKGIVASTAALAVLLQEGIGDTIRVSLTPRPDESRTREVEVAQEILQAMGLRAFLPQVTACPGCGRTTSSAFQHLAQEVEEHLRARMPEWRQRFPGVETLRVAVMGCVVNGPGESKQAHIGISLPGTGEQPAAPVYADGARIATLRGANLAADFLPLIDAYVRDRYSLPLSARENPS